MNKTGDYLKVAANFIKNSDILLWAYTRQGGWYWNRVYVRLRAMADQYRDENCIDPLAEDRMNLYRDDPLAQCILILACQVNVRVEKPDPPSVDTWVGVLNELRYERDRIQRNDVAHPGFRPPPKGGLVGMYE